MCLQGFFIFGGERGIRTPGPVTVNSFQDCRNRPLCHFSVANVRQQLVSTKFSTYILENKNHSKDYYKNQYEARMLDFSIPMLRHEAIGGVNNTQFYCDSDFFPSRV